MNNEIKEINIKIPGQILDYVDTKDHLLDLFNYITNLQQANKSLTEQLEYLRSGEYLNQVKWERDLNENLNQTMSIELINYKSRCEKAIEYLDKVENLAMLDGKIIFSINIFRNILQNEDDSNE